MKRSKNQVGKKKSKIKKLTLGDLRRLRGAQGPGILDPSPDSSPKEQYQKNAK